jgi:hypothetical protein
VLVPGASANFPKSASITPVAGVFSEIGVERADGRCLARPVAEWVEGNQAPGWGGHSVGQLPEIDLERADGSTAGHVISEGFGLAEPFSVADLPRASQYIHSGFAVASQSP